VPQPAVASVEFNDGKYVKVRNVTKLATIYFAIVLILSWGSHAAAQDRMQAAQATVKNMAEETLECAAYFDIVSLALLNSNGGDTGQEYIKARKLAVDRAESLSQGIVNARYNVLIRDMTNRIVKANVTKRIDESLSNIAIEDISVLRDRYAKLCKEVLDEPGARAKYWMERVGPSP
jgi:hypothetical protein